MSTEGSDVAAYLRLQVKNTVYRLSALWGLIMSKAYRAMLRVSIDNFAQSKANKITINSIKSSFIRRDAERTDSAIGLHTDRQITEQIIKQKLQTTILFLV